jgi:hypothetical protein
VIPSALLMLAGRYIVSFNDGLRSTYICPLASHDRSHFRLLAILAVLLDFLLLVLVSELARADPGSTLRHRLPLPLQIGYSFLVSFPFDLYRLRSYV